jgi:hypothetical protein
MIGVIMRLLTCIGIVCRVIVSGALVEPPDDV